MADLTCPVCDVPLVETRSGRAVWWLCPSCDGRALGIALLRRSAEHRWVNELWGHAFEERVPGRNACPSCERKMSEASAGGLSLDVCFGCQLVWFDTTEYDAAPISPEEEVPTLPQEALEQVGRVQSDAIKARYDLRFHPTITPADALPYVPGLAGLPIEDEPRELSSLPWVTWSLTLVLFLLGLWSLFHPVPAEAFGLFATAIDRWGGATFLTSLVVHAAGFQLATNLYFLLFFGDNVEDALGSVVFGALLLVGGLFGNVLHALLDAGNPAALMGASGAISAVVVFYAFRFPDVQLRWVRLLRWHTMPARAGLLFWILAKLASTQPVFGRAEPSLWPHVGGSVIGLVFWLVLRDSPAREG